MPDFAVIFDVDGVLLELTAAEEDTFFAAFEKLHGLTGLSRDWDSYRIRNDCDIIREILETHLDRLPSDEENARVASLYLDLLRDRLSNGELIPVAVPGVAELLNDLSRHGARLGIATSNLLGAAQTRLEAAGLWHDVSAFPQGAEPGGHKRNILARVIAALDLPKHRIFYVGDNLNDVDAGLSNGVNFIGFSQSPAKQKTLQAAGAVHTAGNHKGTFEIISRLIDKAGTA